MKLHVVSDLHIEFKAFDLPRTDADTIVLAGDVNTGARGMQWAREKCVGKRVVYVLGNHEYYSEAFPRHLEKLRSLARLGGIHLLENDTVEIEDVVVLGCTLWTDFALFGNAQVAGYEASQKMTDFRKIRVSPSYRRLRPADTAVQHERSVRWLRQASETASAKKLVVVTHHAPSKRSLPPGFGGDILSAAYASNLDNLVVQSKAILWIHGHVHRHQDYVLGSTRVICNPKGYPDEPDTRFDPSMVVEV